MILLLNVEDRDAFVEKLKTLSYFNSYTIVHDQLTSEILNGINAPVIPEGTICKLFRNPSDEIMRWDYNSLNLGKAYLLNPDKDYKPTYFIRVDSVEL